MVAIYKVRADKLNSRLAEALKGIEEMKMPEWARYVKTSSIKERPPQDEDWWYKRAASILRQFCISGVLGVNRLRRKYGGRNKRGAKPAKYGLASGKIIRKILQKAEKAGLLQKSTGKKKGRELTDKGLEFIKNIINELKGEQK